LTEQERVHWRIKLIQHEYRKFQRKHTTGQTVSESRNKVFSSACKQP
jgi:hypothetical protein